MNKRTSNWFTGVCVPIRKKFCKLAGHFLKFNSEKNFVSNCSTNTDLCVPNTQNAHFPHTEGEMAKELRHLYEKKIIKSIWSATKWGIVTWIPYLKRLTISFTSDGDQQNEV